MQSTNVPSEKQADLTGESADASAGWRLECSYASLPGFFFSEVEPTPVRAPGRVVINRGLATALGLDPEALATEEGVAWCAGNRVPAGARPIAQAYAGHQFGHFTMLGDGRAILIGEQIAPGGERFDIQWKGAGRTPYSRNGDGRAALGPMLREYLVCEAMAALGVPTTRSLAVVTTGEPVFRDGPLPGAVLVRVASSHLRVGTFEWAALAEGTAELEALCAYAIWRHFPWLAESAHPARGLFEAVRDRQAMLIARWQAIGFVHGVMNTDNMALSGETLDYGPCAFMDRFDPATVFSSIDRHGRYAYGNQPGIAQWNLARLAEAMLPLFDPSPETALDYAQAAVAAFKPVFEAHWLEQLRAKTGLVTSEPEDARLLDDLLVEMKESQLDWTRTFRALASAAAGGESPVSPGWTSRWRARLARQSVPPEELQKRLRRANPALIPRNHKVEEALRAAVEDGNLIPFLRLLDFLRRPFDEGVPPEYLEPMPDGGRGYRTFCGT